jgi:hypothetical protein
MRYVPFDLQEWLANPKGKKVVWVIPDIPDSQEVRHLVHFPSVREGDNLAGVVNDYAYLFTAADLAFELPDLPEEEWWMREYEYSYYFSKKHPFEDSARRGAGTSSETLWHIRINRNDGTLRGEVVRKSE